MRERKPHKNRLPDSLKPEKAKNMTPINIHQFKRKFEEEYSFLYDNDDNVAGYQEAVDEFDKFLEKQGDFVGEFARYRGDYVSSDREAAAFMFALSSMLYQC